MLFYDIILKDIVNYRAVSKPITIWVFSPKLMVFPQNVCVTADELRCSTFVHQKPSVFHQLQ